MSGKVVPVKESKPAGSGTGSGIYVPAQERKERSFGKGNSRIQSVKQHKKTEFAAADIAQETQEKRADSFNTRRQSMAAALDGTKNAVPTIADLKRTAAHKDSPAERVALMGTTIASGDSKKGSGLVTLDGTEEPEEPLLIRGPSGNNKMAMNLVKKKIRHLTMKELRFVLLEVAGNDLSGAKAIIRVLDAFERKKRIKYGSSSRSYGSEVDNLDAIIMIKNFNQNPLNLLACLVQGHGRNGKRVGQHVANQLPAIFESDEGTVSETNIRSALHSAFLKMEALLWQGLESYNSGATASMIVLTGKTLWVANVGKLQVVIGRRNAKTGKIDANLVSAVHTPESEPEKQRIEKAGGIVGKWKLTNVENVGETCVWKVDSKTGDANKSSQIGINVSRSLGDFRAKDIGIIADPTINQISLSKDDEFIIVGSEGLWGAIKAQEAVDLVSQYRDSQKAAEALTLKAEDLWEMQFRGENVSACVISLANHLVDTKETLTDATLAALASLEGSPKSPLIRELQGSKKTTRSMSVVNALEYVKESLGFKNSQSPKTSPRDIST